MFLVWMVARAEPGSVTVPLDVWEQRSASTGERREVAAVPLARALTGRVERGRLIGEISLRVSVSGGVVDVPVVSSEVTLVDAQIDGKPVVPSLGGPFVTVRADPGVHEVRFRFVQGSPTERFERRVDLALPPGGPSAVDLLLPESPVEATLKGGVITRSEAAGEGTRISGFVDASGLVHLSWQRRLEHASARTDVDLAAHVDALVEVGEDVATGVAKASFVARAGSADQLSLDVPPGVEVLDAAGTNVLQWYTTREQEGSTLVVLLREAIEDDASVTVRFQYPVERGADLPIVFPHPPSQIPTTGVVGVEAPAGFEVETASVTGALELQPRDVPRSVLDLSEDPVRAAFSFEAAPQIALRVSRQPELPVVTTRIDDLQTINVLLADGGEVGKMRMTVRNTTRQVLTVDLPEGGRLTHCFRDGLPLRPATEQGRPERVLVPLTRSEQQGPTTHTIEPGDTLSSIALRYTGSGSTWRAIAAANSGLDPSSLIVGQTIEVPASADGAKERSFVLELAWERRSPPVGAIGWRTVAVPKVDLEVMSADWHVYLPERMDVLWASTDLVLEGQRDPIRRILDGLVLSTLPGATAYAGGGSYDTSYSNILSSRRALYEKQQKDSVERRTDPFPLVGKKHALHGTLLGTDPLTLDVAFLDRGLAETLQKALFWLTAAAILAFAWAPSRRTAALLGAITVTGTLVGFGIIGSWSRMLWGADLGLMLVLCVTSWGVPAPLKYWLPGAAVTLLSMALFALCSGSPLLMLVMLLGGVAWTTVAGRMR